MAHMSAYVHGWKLGQERLVLAQQCPRVTPRRLQRLTLNTVFVEYISADTPRSIFDFEYLPYPM